MTAHWRGMALIDIGIAGFVGEVGDNRPHRHYAVQITVSANAPVPLTLQGQLLREAKVVGCPANVQHQLHAHGAPVAIIYLEPTTAIGRIAHQYALLRRPFAGPDAPLLHAGAIAAISEGSARKLTHLVSLMLKRPPPPSADLADARIEDFLETFGSIGVPPGAPQAAAHLGLSPSRFVHLFAAGCGISYRAFRKWRKLRTALEAFAAGSNLTTAAHEGGFADSAHFSRTFADMFGTSPSVALRGLRFQDARHE